jgi:hypothetical protein
MGTAATTGVLYQPRMIGVIVIVEKSVEWRLARKTEVLGENVLRYHFVHYKPHMRCPDANPGRRDGKPATNRLSYGMASFSSNLLDQNDINRL